MKSPLQFSSSAVSHSTFGFTWRVGNVVPIVLLFMVFLLPSCMAPVAEKTAADCPVPAQNCQPGSWNGTPFDGIASYGKPGIFHKLDIVAASSPDDDLALAFSDNNEAYLTIGTDVQAIYRVTRTSATQMRVFGRIHADALPTVGIPVVRNGKVILAGVHTDAQTGDGDVWNATFSGTEITGLQRIEAPISLPLVWDSHPALSPDGTILFFASDRSGGYGGTDIWYSIREQNSWGEPYNCGPVINTECDELSPFVSRDGSTLLFASSGHTTVGGYDLFFSDIRPGLYNRRDTSALFGAVRNPGPPLNSTGDELFPSSPARFDTLLYFSSNRLAPAGTPPGANGGFDMYVLHLVASADAASKPLSSNDSLPRREQQTSTSTNNSRHRDTASNERVTVRGRVTEYGTRHPVDSAGITVREVTSQEIVDRTFTDSNGRYTVQVPVEREVEITAQGKQLFYDAKRLRIKRGDTTTVLLSDFSLPGDLSLRINFPTDEYSNPYPYLLDSNGLPTTQTWQEAVDLLAENLKIYKDNIHLLILTGHTDDVASDAYNKVLGMRRARFVINELIRRGIPASKLEARSEGERRLLPQRESEPIELYRARCRRVDLTKEMSFILPGTE